MDEVAEGGMQLVLLGCLPMKGSVGSTLGLGGVGGEGTVRGSRPPTLFSPPGPGLGSSGMRLRAVGSGGAHPDVCVGPFL